MPSKRVPNPQETIKIRRLTPGEPVTVTGTITRADDKTVTFRIAGHPIPVTVPRSALGQDD